MKNNLPTTFFKYFSFLILTCLIAVNSFCGHHTHVDGSADILDAQLQASHMDDLAYAECLLASAFDDYYQSNWAQAKIKFFKYLTLKELRGQEDVDTNFFYAQSCFNSGDYLMAVEVYSTYLKAKEPLLFSKEAEWERAIATIPIDRDMAKRYLKKLTENSDNLWKVESMGLLQII